MLSSSILKGKSSMFLCGIGQAGGSISFSHLPFLQGQGTPALMAVRAHTSPSAPGFTFGFLPTWSVLFASGNQTAPGRIQLSSWQCQGRDVVIALAQPKCSWQLPLRGEHSRRDRLVGKHSPGCNGSGGQVTAWEKVTGYSDKTTSVMSVL